MTERTTDTGVARRSFLIGSAATAAVATASGSFLGLRPAGASTDIAPEDCPVDTIVLVCMENRSFDHMLGRLPGVDGLTREMYNLDQDGERVYVHNQKDFLCTIGDLNHGHGSSIDQVDGGSMGGFVLDTGTQAMGYMGERQIPWMYALASNYTVFDRWHCGILGPTFPNRRYLHAGTSNGATSNDFTDDGKPGFQQQTIWDQLNGIGKTWKQYYTDVPFAALYLGLTFANFDKFTGVSNFYSDAAAGTLANVSVVEPGLLIGTDDHPPVSVASGQRFLSDVIAACMASPQWPRMAILITYDEHGGFFDHVAPPTVPDDVPELTTAGIRVPAILVSPWAKQGAVSSVMHTHASFPKFVQWRFGLPPLTARNAAENDILDAFAFDQPMRTDVPTLLVPPIDEGLVNMCLMGRMFQPTGRIHMPGGEGAESETKWDDSEMTIVSRLASTLQSLPNQAAAALTPEQLNIPAAQPELEEAIRQGVIPAELDQTPKPGKPTPTPFLDRSQLPTTPAWQGKKTVTATRRRAGQDRRYRQR